MSTVFGMTMLEADLSLYTAEEIALAQEMHDEDCTNGCPWGAFLSLIDPYTTLDLAREIILDRPQSEVLF